MELRTCPCSSNYLGQAVDAVKAGRFGRFALVLRGSQEAAGARRAILTQVDAGAVFAVPVYTFDQLATVLMRRLDIEPKGSVSEIQRELLVAAALAQCKIAGELGPLAQGAERDGVARSLAELFAVMDGAGLDPERLEKALITGSGGGMEMVSNFGHDAVDNLSPCINANRIPSAHAADVLSVWRRYCELLDFTGRAERGRLYSAIAQSLRSAEGRSRHGLESVRVAGYAWIGGLEAVLLSALAEASVDVEIELRCPPGHGGYALDAMEEAVSPARVVGVELPARQTPPRLIAAAGPRREACAVAREIKRLIVDEGVRPAQVCVASADSEGFVPMFLEALDEFQVPATVSRKRLMIESSLVLDCLEVARLLGAIGRPFDIMPLVASPYLGLGPRRAGQIARAINLKGLELPLAGWEAKLEKCDPSGDCDGQRYAALLAEAAEQAEDVRRASGSSGLAGYVDGFRAALARLGMPDRIFALPGDPMLGAEEWMAWATFHSLLLEISNARDVWDASREPTASSMAGWTDFYSLLSFAAGRRSFALNRPSPNGVEVMGLDRAASCDREFLFVSGLGEQMLPRRRRRPWMLQESDVQALARAGVSLEPMGNGAEADRHVFNTLVHSRAERIYLSYATAKEDGSLARRSFFVDEHLRSLGVSDADEHEITQTVPASSVFPMRWDDVASKREARMRSLWSMGRVNAAGMGSMPAEPKPEAGACLWLRNRDVAFAKLAEVWLRRQVAEIAEEDGYGHFRGCIGCDELLEKMAATVFDVRPWSANSLNEYIKCPFSFFCQSVLGIEPPDEVGDDVDARDKGTCLHEIVKEFISRHIGEPLDPNKADQYCEEITRIASDVVDRTPSERSGVPASVWDAYFAGIIAASRDFVIKELEFTEATGGVWRPIHLEWPFGSSVRQLAVGEGRVPVTGRIDRIDAGPGGALAIYDYKSGKTVPSARNIKEVADIQLGLYALAAESLLKAEVAGVWYYQVPSLGRTEGVWRAGYHQHFNAGRKRAGKLDDDQWCAFAELVEETVERCDRGARQGMFSPQPSEEACRYCSFPDVCRVVELDAGDAFGKGGGQDV